MARVEKIIEKMKNQPNGIRFSELAKVLKYHGYIEDGGKGSHRVFRKEGEEPISIPERNPVKSVYVKKVLGLIGEE